MTADAVREPAIVLDRVVKRYGDDEGARRV